MLGPRRFRFLDDKRPATVGAEINRSRLPFHGLDGVLSLTRWATSPRTVRGLRHCWREPKFADCPLQSGEARYGLRVCPYIYMNAADFDRRREAAPQSSIAPVEAGRVFPQRGLFDDERSQAIAADVDLAQHRSNALRVPKLQGTEHQVSGVAQGSSVTDNVKHAGDGAVLYVGVSR